MSLAFIPSECRAPLHVLFELLGYVGASAIYIQQRRKHGDVINDQRRSTVLCAMMLGAALGSRVLAVFEDPGRFSWRHLFLLDSGKTIVGAILGGWLAVEIVKRHYSIHSRTGDLLVKPLLFGIILGRLGCFFAGISDGTFGTATGVPWGTDFGDGLTRHPLQLYEIGFLVLYFLIFENREHIHFLNGDRFRLFVFSYLGFRFALEFLKDGTRFAAMNILQWTSLLGMLWCLPTLIRIVSRSSMRKVEELA